MQQSLDEKARVILDGVASNTHCRPSVKSALDEIDALMRQDSVSSLPDHELARRYGELCALEEKLDIAFMNHCAAQMGC